MYKYIIISVGFILMTSCASTLNKRLTTVWIYAKDSTEVVYNSQSFLTENTGGFNSVQLNVPRSKDSLQLEVIQDTLHKKISIPSKVSGMYYLNWAHPLLWPGLLIERSHPRRYTYHSLLILDDSLNIITSENSDPYRKNIIKQRENLAGNQLSRLLNHTTNKNDFFLNFSFPFIYASQSFIKHDYTSGSNGWSALGLAAGLEYYYKNNRFINLSGSITAGGDVRIGCGYDDWEDEERVNIYDITLSHNHRRKYFSYGYGLTYRYIDWWMYKYFEDDIYTPKGYYHPVREHFERYYSTLGLALNGYAYFSNHFSIGVIYKPTFLRLKPGTDKRFCYEHQISIDIAFKLRLYKGK